jgi:hypothetical protein
MRKLILLITLALLPGAQALAQSTMKEVRKACAAESKQQGLEGSAAKKFRKQCVQTRSADLPESEKQLTPQQTKMKKCAADAKAQGLKGEEYKTFRNECLRSKPI